MVTVSLYLSTGYSMKALALVTALSFGALFFGGTSSAADMQFSDLNAQRYNVDVQESTAEPLDDTTRCTVTSSKEDVWRIKGNCNVSCYSGIKTGCLIEGEGPGKGEADGHCKITHTISRNADIVGYCPHHMVTCVVSLTNVKCSE